MAESGKRMESVRIAKLLLLFIVSYGLMYVISLATPLMDWDYSGGIKRSDYTTFLLPVAGFFFSFFAIEWLDSYMNRFGSSVYYPIAVTLLGFGAYYAAVWYFMQNIVVLGGSGNFDFWQIIQNYHFIYFIIAADLAWVSKKLMNYFPE